MTKTERHIADFIDRHLYALLAALFLLIGLAFRWVGRGYLSGDMTGFLIPWYDEIRSSGGLASLSHQVGDYGLLYQTLISLMTYIDWQPAYQYKILSVAFDIALAFIVGRICTNAKTRCISTDYAHHWRGGVFPAAAIFLLPTVVIDSAYWGQCDAMYSTFCVATLYCLSRDAFRKAFVFLGLAFACKLQTVFILPLILAYYMKSRKFSLSYLLLSAAVVWATGAVAFLYGRSLLAPLSIYHTQTVEYTHMYLNFPSFWMLTGDNYAALGKPAILLTFALCALGVVRFYEDRREAASVYYHYAVWFAWTMVLFLPKMHERYSYLLDVLLILTACMDRRVVKYAVVSCCISLWTYSNYIFMRDAGERYMTLVSVVFTAAYAHYSYHLLSPSKEKK